MLSTKRYSILFLSCVFLLLSASAALGDNKLPDFVSLVKSAGPAVVHVQTERTVSGMGAMPFNFPPMFKQFEDFFDQNMGSLERKQEGAGSGFIISSDGYIVTNHHVVDGADSIKVTIDGQQKGENYTATLVGSDPETDLALLQITAKAPLPTLRFGNSDALEVGEWVVAIGNPFGLDRTVTKGILSAKNRQIGSGPYDDFLQTDASINPGNSGGPLLNMQGEVIGINTLIIARGQGIGFAIPSVQASAIIEQLKNHQVVSRGWMGVVLQEVDENVAKAVGLTTVAGALVGDVLAGEPAAKAGIESGDIIVSLNGSPVLDSDTLSRSIASFAPNTSVTLGLWRNNAVKDVTVTLTDRANAQAVASGTTPKVSPAAKPGDVTLENLGLSLRLLTTEEKSKLGIAADAAPLLITKVAANSPAAEARLRRGDLILAVNKEAVVSVDAFMKRMNEDGRKNGAVLLQVQSGKISSARALAIPDVESSK